MQEERYTARRQASGYNILIVNHLSYIDFQTVS